jgi:hypothetical protein
LLEQLVVIVHVIIPQVIFIIGLADLVNALLELCLFFTLLKELKILPGMERNNIFADELFGKSALAFLSDFHQHGLVHLEVDECAVPNHVIITLAAIAPDFESGVVLIEVDFILDLLELFLKKKLIIYNLLQTQDGCCSSGSIRKLLFRCRTSR